MVIDERSHGVLATCAAALTGLRQRLSATRKERRNQLTWARDLHAMSDLELRDLAIGRSEITPVLAIRRVICLPGVTDPENSTYP